MGRLDQGAAVIRLNTDPAAFVGTETTLAALRALELPVPSVRASGTSPMPYVILDWLPGRDLGAVAHHLHERQLGGIAAGIAEVQRRTSTLHWVGGFGTAPAGAAAPQRTWREVLGGLLAPALSADDELRTLADKIDRGLDRRDAELAAVVPVAFLDDLSTRNVLVRRGRLVGLVDLDAVLYGDPRLHLGLVTAAFVSSAPRCSIRTSCVGKPRLQPKIAT